MRRVLLAGASAQTIERALELKPLTLSEEVALVQALCGNEFVAPHDEEFESIFRFPGEDIQCVY